MNNFKKIQLIICVLISSLLIAQQEAVVSIPFPASVVKLLIKPSETNSAIKNFDSAHLVIYNPNGKQGKLLVFLPGTNGVAVNGPQDFFATAIKQGYRVISLQYITVPAVAQVCIGDTLSKNPLCTEEFRTHRIFGNNDFSLILDQPQDAIIPRLKSLLEYLNINDPRGNWKFYLENGVPIWNIIALAGQSQGGGMAAFIGKQLLVNRVISFSGGWDFAAKNEIAKWYYSKSITPDYRWNATYHISEPTASILEETYKAMKIPSNHIYRLDKEVRPDKLAHGEGVKNPAYVKVWKEMMGIGELR